MTDEQINAAIAEACGWTDFSEHPDWGTMAIEPGTHGLRTMIPSYSADLNWMHEAEKVLTELQCAFFASNLRERLENHSASRYIWHATARQRSEAFLRTLGKWEEVQG